MDLDKNEKDVYALFEKIRTALANQKGIGSGRRQTDGLKAFSVFLEERHPKQAVSDQTLRNYKLGKYTGSAKVYDTKRLNEIHDIYEPLVEEYLSYLLHKDTSKYVLNGTSWYVYFFNKFSDITFGDRCNLGRAILNFSGGLDNLRADLINVPDDGRQNKSGKCEIIGSTLIGILKDEASGNNLLNIMLDSNGRITNQNILIGGYQAREDMTIKIGTLLLERIDGVESENRPAPMLLSFNQNIIEFENIKAVIKRFFANESNSLIQLPYNYKGSLTGLREGITKEWEKKNERVKKTFLEPDCPKIFISCPFSFLEKDLQINIGQLIEKLKIEIQERVNYKVEIVHYSGTSDNPTEDCLEVMDEIKQSSIFIFIYPSKEHVASTSLVELGWALMSVKNIFVYSKSEALPQKLEDYLNQSRIGVVKKTYKELNEAYLRRILSDVIGVVRKLYRAVE